MEPTIERRYFASDLRMEGEGDIRRMVGYGAVFSSLSENLGGFVEEILPGAFSDQLREDVRALFNHDANLILGRTLSGTLVLSEDGTGLRYEVMPPETQYAKDLMVSIDRGDVDRSSFGFRVIEESWVNPTEEQPLPVRRLHKVRLYDVGPVVFPAYAATSVSMRAMDKAKEMAAGGRATGAGAEEIEVGRRDLLRRKLNLRRRNF